MSAIREAVMDILLAHSGELRQDRFLFYVLLEIVIEAGFVTRDEIMKDLQAGDLAKFEAIAAKAWGEWDKAGER